LRKTPPRILIIETTTINSSRVKPLQRPNSPDFVDFLTDRVINLMNSSAH